MTMQGRKRRRDVLSNPAVQLRIIFVFAAIALLFAVTNWYVSVRTLHRAGDMVAQMQLSNVQRMDAEVIFRQQGETLQIQLMMLTFASFVLLCLAGVLMSHTIAGPIHQLSEYLKNVVEQKVPPRRISFRRRDFFQDVALRFNVFQEKYGILNNRAEEKDRAAEE